MMLKAKTLLLGLLCLFMSFTAPFIVPFALMFTARDAKQLAWSWYATPDEPDFFDLDMVTVAKIHAALLKINDGVAWFLTAWYWFGWRNRAHGFTSLWSEEASAYWPREDGSYMNGEKFMVLKHFLGPLRFEFGWPVYASTKYKSKLEFRPMISIKWRPVKA